MATFLFSYRMPVSYQPGRPDAIANWTAFFEGMGDHVADAGQPVSETAEVGNCGAGTRPGGYPLITADNWRPPSRWPRAARPWMRVPGSRSACSRV